MNVGISTACLYPLETEKALEQLIARGFSRFEVFLNSFSELGEPVRGRLLELSKECEIVSLHPFTAGFESVFFFGDYTRRVDDGIEMYKPFFQLTAELGGRYVVFHGARRNFEISYELYGERYMLAHETAKRMGVQLLHENVERCMSRDPELFRYLGRHIPDAGFVLDFKQAARAGVDPLDMIEAMGAGLRHIHASDAAPGQNCLPVGRGELDFTGLLSAAGAKGFDGSVILELYSSSYRQQSELEQSVALLQQYVQGIQLNAEV